MQTLRLTVLLCGLLALAPRPAQAACPQDTWAGTVWNTWDADAFTRSGAMQLNGNPEYFRTSSGGNQNDNGSVPTCASAGCADIGFTLTTADAGYYKVETLVRADNGNEDSYFVGLVGLNDTCGGNTAGSSGNPAVRRWDITESNNNYVWRYVTDWNNNNNAADARVWLLGAGSYTLRFIGREPDVRVRQVRLRRLLTGTPATPTYTRTRTPTPVIVAGSPTHTPTPGAGSPTRTPTPLPPVWGGLPAGKRLNGLEYIPFPEIRINPDQIHGLSVTFSSQAANNLVRNTSRWRIVFQSLTGTVGSQVQLETRLGPEGEACLTGFYNSSGYSAATTLALPLKPQNLSSTYFWVDGVVPVTERFDAMGDPRYMPYADLIGAASNADDMRGGYNWFYKDMQDTNYSDHEDEYEPFLGQARYNRYNNQPNFDVPKLFALWREGVVASRSIYTSMTGYSSYYIGVGGEIGGDAANKLSSGGVPAYNGPWGTTGNGGKEEIIGSTVLVRNAGWISRPELGELWPDASYASDWYSGGANTTWGNLRNNQQGGNAYRQARQTALPGTGTAPYNYEFLQVRHRTQEPGSASFMNGHGGSGQFNHFYDANFNATLMYDGQRMAQDYNFAMPATFNVNRSWGLIQGGNQPNEWNQWPYRDRRIALDIYSAAGTTANYNFRGFYRRDGGVDAHQRASAAVRGIESSGVVDPDGLPAAGWFVINGLAPSTDSGINFVARFAILSCLRTFHDAGVPTTMGNTRNQVGANVFRIATVPLVQITQPKVGQDVAGLGTIVLEWKKRSARWDLNRYTENYPCLDVDQPPCSAADATKPENPANEWHDNAVLVFNIKYSLDGGGSWFSALTGSPAKAGVYMDGGDSLAEVANHLYQYSWDVSGLAAGSKLVRVEAYRRDLGLHYAYHEMAIVTAP